jgi:outer membrane protein OmpA-like peptidoglycan-associated protein
MKIYNLILSGIFTGMALTGMCQDNKNEAFFTEPVRLSDVINSDAEEVMPVYTENEMYFVRAFHEENTGGKNTGHDIWVGYQDNRGEWRRANNYFLRLNDKGSNAVVGVGSDGRSVYLLNNYVEGGISVPGISVSRKRLTEWSNPEPLKVPGIKPNTRIYGLYITPEEDVLFISMETEGTNGKEDLYVSTKTGEQWSQPQHLADLSSDGFDISPFLSPDRSTLYFASDRSGGQGDSDIYKATRMGNNWTDWSEPENLGELINSNGFDAYFTITSDSLVYFASNRDGGLSDIYAAELATVETFSEEDLIVRTRVDIEYDWNRPNYVYFDFDKYDLRPSMKAFLQNIVDTLDVNNILRIRLEGHADAIGTQPYNKSLGRKRAKTVEKFLTDHGVDKKKITTYSFGETMPIMPNRIAGKDFPEGRQMNRRVRIEIVDQETFNEDKKGVKGYINN